MCGDCVRSAPKPAERSRSAAASQFGKGLAATSSGTVAIRVLWDCCADAFTTLARGREDLWRGMRNAEIPEEFLQLGGTELAPMSTTTDLAVAMEYCASKNALILRLNTASFMERGADISFLSAFPTEKEVLYPPLTFMRATGAKQTVKIGDSNVTIMEVIPSM